MIFMIIEVREEEGEESGLVEIEGNENLWEGGKYKLLIFQQYRCL